MFFFLCSYTLIFIDFLVNVGWTWIANFNILNFIEYVYIYMFVISVLLLKKVSLLQFCISHLNIKIKCSAYYLDFKNGIFWLFSQKPFDSSVSFLYLMWLNGFLSFPKLSLKLFYMSQGNIFICIQRWHCQCWIDSYAFCLVTIC